MTDETRQTPAETVSHAAMTGNERFLLGWLHDEDGPYGECCGPSLDALIAKERVTQASVRSLRKLGYDARLEP